MGNSRCTTSPKLEAASTSTEKKQKQRRELDTRTTNRWEARGMRYLGQPHSPRRQPNWSPIHTQRTHLSKGVFPPNYFSFSLRFGSNGFFRSTVAVVS